MVKKTFAVLLTVLLLLFPNTAQAQGPELACDSAILLDANGAVLYELNSEEQHYPASVTKIMTLVLTLEAVERGDISLDDLVTVSAEAAGMGGSQVYLFEGEQRSVNDMLIAIAVGSGNDAAYATAEFVGGSLSGFVELMNERALELGMTHTQFANPHGLHDENHYTTAADLGRLACHALSVPRFLDYTSIYEYEFRPEPRQLILWNTNRLLKWYEGTDGMKTGYTEAAKRNLVATVERNGMRLVSVVLGCAERQGHYKESMELLNYGFNNFSYELLYPAGQSLADIAVSKGESDSVALVLEKDIGYVRAKGDQSVFSDELSIAPSLPAPVRCGDVGGTLNVYKDGQPWQSFELVAANDVGRGGWSRTWNKLLGLLW